MPSWKRRQRHAQRLRATCCRARTNGAKKKKAKKNSAALYRKLTTSCLNGKERESYARRKDSAHQSVAQFWCFSSLMKAPGNDVCTHHIARKINWTRLWVAITHVRLDFSARFPTLGAGLHLIMEKLSRRWRCRLVSACGTRLINNRLSETCAHHCLSGPNLHNVQASPKKEPSLPITAGLTHGPPAAAQSCWTEVVFLIVLIQSSTSQAGDAVDEN